MKAAILGATSGIGQAVSRVMAIRGDDLFLLGRDRSKLELCAKDLEARSGRPVAGYCFCELECYESIEKGLTAAEAVLEGLDTIILTAAYFDTQENLESDWIKIRKLLTVDFTNAILFCEVARKRLLKKGGGTLCVLSSVAGDRGRKPVILYGAAKAGLSYYLEGLDHKYYQDGLRVVCVKPGFIRTPMTADLTPPPFAGTAALAALQIVQAIEQGKPIIYTPSIWRWIMLAIRCLPRWAMRRINF